jgi:hypothetical protein
MAACGGLLKSITLTTKENMHKEKSEKSRKSDVSFPAGDWSVSIRDDTVNMGRLNLAGVSQSSEQDIGTVNFANNNNFGPIKDRGFSAEGVFDPETGVIYFKLPAAAEEYNSKTSPPYQFVFIGWYCKPDEMCGKARVPKGFGLQPGNLGEDGDDVTWIAKGITDPPHKHSK